MLGLVGRGSVSSLTAWLQQGAQLRGGADDGTGGALQHWLATSLPTAVGAATNRGRCVCRGVTRRGQAAAVAGGLRYRNIGGDDRRPGGVGRGQRTDVVVVVVVGGDPSIHGLIVALLVMR